MGKAWKRAEKEVAKFFGGLRRVRINYSESIGDIIHSYYTIEVKWGKQIPKYLAVKRPIILTVGSKPYKVVPSEYLRLDKKRLATTNVYWMCRKLKKAEFLTKAVEQARRYNPTLRPLVCVKPKRRRGFVCVWEM